MGTCSNVNTLVTLMSIVNSYINQQSTPSVQLQDGERYDFIIVGGGSAGCVLANRLSEIEDWKILLLEAGGEEPLELDVPAFRDFAYHSRVDWGFHTQPQDGVCGGKPCYWPRGKVLGGTTVFHSMIYNRGNRMDYDHWALLGNIGWSYKDNLPYFKKSENNTDPDIAKDIKYHSTGGYLSVGRFPYQDKNVRTIVKGFEELGYEQVDFNSDQVTGVMVIQATQTNGARLSNNRAFLSPVRKIRSNLVVATGVRATRVLIHPENNTAYGVEYAYENNRTVTGTILATKEVIVSCGAVSSPQLLMLSGIGPEKLLQSLGIKVVKNLKVGENLQDHVTAKGVVFNFDENLSTVPTDEELKGDFHEYTESKRNGPLSGTGVNQLEGYIKSRYIPKFLDYPDIQYFMYTSIISSNPSQCSINITRPLSYYNQIDYLAALVRPQSRGYISISSKDPFQAPLIYPNYFNDSRDLKVLIDACNEGIRLSETKVMKDAGYKLNRTRARGCESYEYGTDNYWICIGRVNTQPLYHPAGTCKMGPWTDSEAVVDQKLRVYGVKNLRVADASIMPIVMSGNLNGGVIMIAEKCADFIKQYWKVSLQTKQQKNTVEEEFQEELSRRMEEISSALE